MSRFFDALGAFFGGVVGRRRVELKREVRKGAEVAGPGVTNAELSVLIQVDQTLAATDRRRAARLVKGQRAVVDAARDATVAWHDLQQSEDEAQWSGHWHAPVPGEPPAEEPAPARGRIRRFLTGRSKRFAEDFDPHRPLIGEHTLTVVETVFLVVEVVFWYGTFAADIDRRVPWYGIPRISAFLLALFLPSAGVLAARVLGRLGHRWVMDYEGIGRRERLGTMVAAVIAIAATTATLLLVHNRFASANDTFGALTVIPAWPMAWMFVVILVGDIAARVFLPSEIRTQTSRRMRAFRKLRQRYIRSAATHAKVWIELRHEIQAQLNLCERIVAIGATMISDNRAEAETPTRDPLNQARGAHRDGVDASLLRVPDSEQLDLFGGQLALGPLRAVEDAIDTLAHFQPQDRQGVSGQIDSLRGRLMRVQERAGKPPAPTLPTVPLPLQRPDATADPIVDATEPVAVVNNHRQP
ncbi:hypothetical protein AB0K00_51830 [Dactylosporangium sp. NPDC049525]|uniref:hypothetical protein n=1 Tax=Dactylosporangium sp. NPDC049525 TaxID=3154730 RepID=UPI00343136D7